MAESAPPKVKLYTNHLCPWAYRAHIILAELQVPCEEFVVDLSVPRAPDFLSINPRGVVPALEYDGLIVTESAIVCTFLADTFPSSVWPESTSLDGPYMRSRINHFVETYFSTAQGQWSGLQMAKTNEEEKKAAKSYVDAVSINIEPLLHDTRPFFGGSDSITLAEVLVGSWLLRVYSLPRYGVVPANILQDLKKSAPRFDNWAKHVVGHPSVRCVWDEKPMVEATQKWINQMRASA